MKLNEQTKHFQLNVKSRSLSVMNNGSGQGESWQMCVQSSISLKSWCFRNGAKHADLSVLTPTRMTLESDPYMAPACLSRG